MSLNDCLKFLYHISPQVISVLIAGLIFQRYFVARSNESAFIDYLVEGLDELRSDALEYWNLEISPRTNREKGRILEQKIKGAIKSLTSELRNYSNRYCKRIDFVPLMTEVADACTGGQFESASRAPDSGRCLPVVNSIHRVKWELMRRKL